MSHLGSGGDSFRPTPEGAIRFQGSSDLAELARELEIDVDDIPPTRYANPAAQTNRTSTVQRIYDLIADAGEDLPARMGAHEMRNKLRAIGIDLGHAADDAQDRRSTAVHEAGHGAIAHALGWTVNSIDLDAGETKFDLPPYSAHESLSDRNRDFGMIGAAGAAASGWSSDREENLNDRISLRAKSIDFEEARKAAEKLLATSDVKACHERLTRALVMVGELHGETLRRVLNDEF
jgi:hypothetical protein